MSPTLLRTTRGTRAVRLALVGGVLALAGCGLVPVEENTFASSPLPAISQENALEVLDRIDAALTEANAARDPVLLAEVESIPLLDIDAARYALDALADPTDADPAAAAAHLDPTVFIPRFEGYPQWFVVAAASAADGPLRLELLTRESAAAPWLTNFAPELLPDVEFPVLALDDAGYVVPLTQADLGDLSADGADIAAQHAAALGGTAVPSTPAATDAATPASTATPTTAPPTARPSGSPPATETASASGAPTTPPAGTAGALGIDTDAWTVARREADAAAAAAVGAAATVASTYDVTGVIDQALRTEDGGALVFYALGGTRTYTVTPTYFLQLDAATAAIVGKPEVTTTLTEQWAAQLAVYIPPSADGSARVVAARWDRTALSGS